MIPIIPQLGSLAPPLADFAIKGSVVVVIAAAIASVLRGASSASRHIVWVAALGGVLLLPFAHATLPAWASPIGLGHVRGGPDIAAGSSRRAPEEALRTRPAATAEVGTPTTSTNSPGATGTLLVACWLAGMLAMSARYVAGTVGVRRLTRAAQRTEDARVVVRTQQLASALGVSRPVTVLTATPESIPVTWGVVYPTVLLPAVASSWSDDCLDAVLTHELGHVARLDAFTQFIAQLAMILAWFNPFVWYAGRRAIAEREHACDDLVLTRGHRASDYASQLLSLTGSLGGPHVPAFAALAMARGSEVGGRVRAILAPAGNRKGASRSAATLSAGLLCVTLGVAAVGPRSSAPQARQSDLAALQGTWDLVNSELDGSKVHGIDSIHAQIVISGNTFASVAMGATYRGTFTLGQDGAHKTLDMLFNDGPEKGHRSLGIYELTADRWTLRIGISGATRPSAFFAARGESGYSLETFVRHGAAPAVRPPSFTEEEAFVSAGPRDTTTELALLGGTWTAVAITSDGQPLPASYLPGATRVAKGHEITVTVAGQVQLHVTVTLLPGTMPKAVDYAGIDGFTQGQKLLGIYELKGDTLRTCFAPPGKPRPAEFVTRSGDGRTLSVWARKS